MLGGNETTLVFLSGFVPAGGIVAAHTLAMASTPIGVVLGEGRQTVGVPMAGLLEWADRTFPADDEHAFVVPAHGIELLANIGWQAPIPPQLDEASVINLDDLPADVADAIARGPEPLVQCAVCRRLCVRDDFVWKERQLCAWDYHDAVFGPRGPWRTGPYEERHFATLPQAAYVVAPLAQAADAEVVLVVAGLDESVARTLLETVLAAEPARPHVAVRTPEGFTLLRETRASQ